MTLNVVVVGAGPIGLAAAYRLSTQGHTVTVVERRPDFIHGPGSIQIPINGNNLLKSWGLESDFDVYTSKKRLMYLERYSNLEKLCTTITEEGSARWVIHRDDLQKIMANRALQAGAKVLFDKEVVGLDCDAATLKMADGSVLSGDLIIGADGLRSTIRKYMFPELDTSPNFTSTICYQAMVSEYDMKSSPETAMLYDDGEIHAIMGPGCYIVTWSQYARKAYYVGILDAKSNEPINGVSGQPEDEKEIVARLNMALSGFASPIKQIFSRASAWTPWHIARGRSELGYVHPGGKVILVADAAHAMTPDAAQGLSQGIEDVEALTTLLDYATADNLPMVAEVYEKLRKPRASRLQEFASANSPIFSFEDGEKQQARDKRLNEIDQAQGKVDYKEVVPDINATFVEPAFRKWMIDYDVRSEANKLARELGLA